MTAKEFKKLDIRDFDNGAVLDEIAVALEQRETLLAACKFLVLEEPCCCDEYKHFRPYKKCEICVGQAAIAAAEGGAP